MENSKSVNYVIKDWDKFIKKMKELGNYYDIGNRIGLAESTVQKWFTNENRPNSENIQLLLDKYNVTPEELGVEEIEKEQDNTKEPFSKNLNNLMEERKITKTELAKELGIAKSTVTNWCKGRNAPTIYQVKQIANIFKVHYLYLLGEIKTINVNNSTINELTGLQDEAINTIAYCYNTKRYGNKEHKQIQEDFGFDYIDIIEYIASDLQLFDIFYNEAVEVFTYHTSPTYRKKFNEYFNEIEIELDNGETYYSNTPYIKSIETFSKAILQKKISRMFDEFIEKKMKEKNIKRKDIYN